jgi:hypothetical protein
MQKKNDRLLEPIEVLELVSKQLQYIAEEHNSSEEE